MGKWDYAEEPGDRAGNFGQRECSQRIGPGLCPVCEVKSSDHFPLPGGESSQWKCPWRIGSGHCPVRESIAVSPGGGNVRQPPVFALAAADVHRTSAFRWVRLPTTSFQTRKTTLWGGLSCLEQGTGIEPAFTAWEAVVLPIYEPCIVREGIIADPEGKCNHFLSGGSPWLWQKRKKQAAFSENPNIF